MKIYVGDKQIDDSSYKTIREPQLINYIADDSECTVIVYDGMLRKLPFDQALQSIDMAYKKLRIDGILKIVDIDFDLLIYAYNKERNIVQLNNSIFSSEIRSFFTVDLMKDIMNQYQKLQLRSLNINNIEFDMEFKKNV